MNLTKHKKWVNDYMKKNYGCTHEIRVDSNCNFVIESWDSRLNIWDDKVPFIKKDRFCKIAEIGSDRDGSFCHYKFVFPFDYVDGEVRKAKNKLVGRKLYLKWDKHMYVSIEKIPAGDKKLLEMEMSGNPEIMLCNIYEDADGKLSEEILGTPANSMSGHRIETYFTHDEFWKTPGETINPGK